MPKNLRSVFVFGTVTAAAVCGLAAGAGTAAGATAAFDGPGSGSARPALPGLAAGGASTWGVARELPGTAGLGSGGSARANSVSCPSAGNCAVGGSWSRQSGAFVADEKAGTWRPAKDVPGAAALGSLAEVISVSCDSAGNCIAGGDYYNGVSQAMVASEVHGVWHAAFTPPGTYTDASGAGSGVTSVSCTAGYCAVGGSIEDNAGLEQAFVASEKHSSWQTAVEVPGTDALNTSGQASVVGVSCSSPGNCAADGYYAVGNITNGGLRLFVANERNGTWGTAQHLPLVLPFIGNRNLGVAPISCATAGNCAAGGSYVDSSGKTQAFVVTEKNGVWQPAREVAAALNVKGQAAVNTISCPSAGNCAAGGTYALASGSQAFVVTEKHGVWQPAHEVAGALNTGGNAGVQSVSCPSVGSCTAVGTYSDAAGNPAFTVTGSIIQPTATTISLSAGKITYGHEQSERITVTVKARYSGIPAGTVTVKAGSAAVCAITLKSGKGSCQLTARKLRRGTYHLGASYAGDQDFLASASAKKTLTVN